MDIKPNKLNICYQNFDNRVMDRCRLFQANNSFQNVKIQCGEYVFNAHKAILSATSPYLYNLLKNANNQSTLRIHNISGDLMSKFLQFMYYGKVHIHDDCQKDFADLLQKFEITEGVPVRAINAEVKTEIKEEVKQNESDDHTEAETDNKFILYSSPKREKQEFENYDTKIKEIYDSGVTSINEFDFGIKSENSPTFGLMEMDDYTFISPYKSSPDSTSRVESSGCARLQIYNRESKEVTVKYNLRNRTVLQKTNVRPPILNIKLEPGHVCEICGMNFETGKGVKMHKKRKHKIEYNNSME